MSTQDGDTALHWAAMKGHLDTVKQLVKDGARLLRNKVSIAYNYTGICTSTVYTYKVIKGPYQQYYSALEMLHSLIKI